MDEYLIRSIPVKLQLDLPTTDNGNSFHYDLPTTAANTANDGSNKYEYPFTIGACLLTRDDNVILPEWLAYHYTVLPLRYLIVAVDPLSITTPEPLFDAFRNHTDMKIEMWTGNFYFSDTNLSSFSDPLKHLKSTMAAKDYLEIHRERQRSFYTNCLQTYKEKYSDIQWVMLLDSDEYFTFNPPLSIELALEGQQEKDIGNETVETNGMQYRKTLPKKIGKQNETIAHWIASERHMRWNATSHGRSSSLDESLCIAFPRLFFSALQERQPEEEKRIISSLPLWFSSKSLHTMRFPGHWPHQRHIPVKSLVNVRNYKGVRKVLNPHRPFFDDCTGSSLRLGATVVGKKMLRVHHYSGDLDTFLLRPSQDEAKWRKRNNFKIEGFDDSLTEWYSWFIDLVGEGTAKMLTLDMIEQAQQEWLDIKFRVENQNETIMPVFDWDMPPLQQSSSSIANNKASKNNVEMKQ